MLVLTRRVGEQVVIRGGVVITVVEVRGRQAGLGIRVPEDVGVPRRRG
jgi:carbon storage regulator CsrA